MARLRTRVLGLLFVVVWAGAGCGGGNAIILDNDGKTADLKADGGGDVTMEVVDEVAEEVQPVDVLDVLPEVEVDGGEMCKPGDGCFGDPCDEAGDCLSGWCVPHMGDTVCTIACVEECPEGWTCQEVSGGPDMIFMCVSNHASLCQPCQVTEDCVSPGVADSACLLYGPDGAFCGSSCEAAEDCPEGFSCVEQMTVEGATVVSCVSDSGECACSATASALGLGTVCQVTNEFGTCTGERFCGPEGMGECTAPIPAEDLCDGVDNDCDGELDTVVCNDDNDCTEDQCGGEEGCQFVGLNETPCDDGDPCTIDVCEQGFCVSTPKDCDDGNVCTDNYCGADGECMAQPNDNLCTDGDPCTTDDQCKLGSCVGTPIDCNCDVDEDCEALEDGDLCTGTLFCDTSKLPYTCKVDEETVVECPEPPEGPDALCLVTYCDPDTGECGFHPTEDGKPCDDANACTVADTCMDGVCTGGPGANCNDGNPCTDDSCDAAGGCVYTNNSDPCSDSDYCTVGDMCVDGECVPGEGKNCDDGNVCTEDTCDPLAGCQNEPIEGACNDQNFCTENDVCLAGVCVAGTPVDCNDGNVCTDDSCAPETGCVHTPNTAPCDDGDECTKNDVCSDGTCGSVNIIPCDDSNPCTADSCDPLVGCVNTPDDALTCDDNNPCTVGDHCAAGACVPTATDECDDQNLCTDDSCDPENGCVNTPNTAPCDDNDACTTGDTCQDGACQDSEAVDCDDDNPCTADSCDPVDGCINVADDELTCDDEDACSEGDHCEAGFCVATPKVCDDGNVCTDDSCGEDGECVFENNTALCDDEDPCTTADKCSEGVCGGTAIDCNCDVDADCAALEDGDLCTGTLYCDKNSLPYTCKVVEDSVVECPEPPAGPDAPCLVTFCNPETGECGFLPTENGKPCDDANACTVGDTCQDGVCTGGPGANCNDGNPCTDDTCDAQGGCVYTNNSEPCNDGSYCTVGDACADGACVPGAPKDCNDGNVCTVDSCEPATGCSNLPADGACDDQNACTDGDSCQAGLCVPGAPVDCNDGNVCTDDACDPLTGCVHVNNTAPCDDNNACTTNDICGGGTCGASSAVSCDDGKPCTADSCDPVTGCVNVADNNLTCDDGNPCTLGDHCAAGLCVAAGTDSCDDNNLCTNDSCDPVAGCINAPNTSACDDGNACTTQDTCGGGQCVGGPGLVCNDSNVCTDDLCVPDTGCVFVSNNAACNDNNACTEDDVCVDGECVGTSSVDCDDGNPCTKDLCLADGGCAYSNIAGACDDEDPCTLNDTCVDGACVSGAAKDCSDGNVCTDDSCDVDGTCMHVNNTAACDDGNDCTEGDVCANGSCTFGSLADCDDGNVCTTDSCNPDGGCTHVNNTNPCNDGNACTTGDVCADGVCAGPGVVTCDDNSACTEDTCDPEQGCMYTAILTDQILNWNFDDGDLGDWQFVPGAGGTWSAMSYDNHFMSPEYAAYFGDANTHMLPPGMASGYLVLDTTIPGDAVAPAFQFNYWLNVEESGCGFDNLYVLVDNVEVAVYCNSTQDWQSGSVDLTAYVGQTIEIALFYSSGDGLYNVGQGVYVDDISLFFGQPIGCEDGNACTDDDFCFEGTCYAGLLVDCDDDNVCTTDSCDPVVGCLHVNNALACNDGDACTTGDICVDGTCVTTGNLDCDDGNVCTDDSCDAELGCQHVNNTIPCNDNNDCTQNDVCAGGVCLGTGSLDCDDSNPCTKDICLPNGGCDYENIAGACSDNDPCTLNDTCVDGTCVPGGAKDCDDGNVCTDDSCDETGTCVHANNADACDDGNACTSGDYCNAGSCTFTDLTDCDDSNICTNDSCNPVTGCINTNNTVPCDDSDACTTGDVCADGVCAGPGVVDCDDDNECTVDTCDADLGCVNAAVTGSVTTNFDDGTLEGWTNQVMTGSTSWTAISYNSRWTSASYSAYFGNPGTHQIPGGDVQTRLKRSFSISNNAVAPTLSYQYWKQIEETNCSWDNLNIYVAGALAVQHCGNTNGFQANSVDLSAHIGQTVEIIFEYDSGDSVANSGEGIYLDDIVVAGAGDVSCDDGNECTENDTCVLGSCVSGPVVDCDDSDVCTTDSCNPATGCLYVNNTNPCNDGNACTTGDVCADGVCAGPGVVDCDDNNPCTDDACDPVAGCVHTNNSDACSDGNACTDGDVCNGGTCVSGAVLDCDDSNVCTTDTCNPATGCAYANNTNPCNDNDLCTTTDVCAGGVCVGSGTLTCDDANACTDDSCDPVAGCVFTPNADACNDGNACTATDVCTAGACVGSGAVDCNDDNTCTNDSCDPATGCVNTAVADCCGNGTVDAGEECDDGNQANGDGCNSACEITLYWASGPQQNVPEADLTGWSVCYSGTYGQYGVPLAPIMSACTGDNLMLACRPVGSTTYTLLAMAPRADVIYNTGNNSNVVHNANGSGWYYYDSRSWGFATEGVTVNKNSCDIGEAAEAWSRLCYHTSGGNMNGGFRCGSTQWLNSDNSWERVVLQSD